MRNIDLRVFVIARSETQCCFVGAQLDGIISVTACVFGFDAGDDCQVGCSTGHAITVGLWVLLPHALHSLCTHTRDQLEWFTEQLAWSR